ncbi:MAG: AEC family transporter [Proteobacteria bacterium]|nr:AEC family transporter [Pseudomonadota bacterium]MDA1023512.1 AEC family transporter [Pseudomonadota bacterium]
MSGILLALAPVFGLIAIGYVLRARGTFSDAFWEPAERLTFYILFPALLVTKIGGAETVGVSLLPMAGAMAGATLLVAVVMLSIRPVINRVGIGGPSFVAIFQGAIRPNSYVGFAVAAALYGDKGLTLAAVATVAVIPLVNFLSIIALLRWAGANANVKNGMGNAVLPVLKNPIIVACLLGATLNISGLGLPPIAGPFLEIIGQAALPLALMAVGAGLNLSALQSAKRPVLGTTLVRLAVMPGATFALCSLFDVAGEAAVIAVMYAGLPVSAASYVMTRQLGGDGPLMARIVTATTIGAALTLPVVVVLVG